MSVRMFDLASRYREIGEEIEAADGELSPELEDAWDAIAAPFGEKLDAIGGLVREFEAEEAGREREIADQTRKRNVARKAILNLKELAKAGMLIAGTKRVKGRFDIRIQANPATVKFIGDPSKLPDELARIIPAIPESREFDPKAAFAIIDKGGDLPEGVVISRGSHLRIS